MADAVIEAPAAHERHIIDYGDYSDIAMAEAMGLGENGSDAAANALFELEQFAKRVRQADLFATFIGLGGGVLGAVLGGFLGRWAGARRPLATIGGAAGGGLALGFSSFYVSRRLLRPIPPITGLVRSIPQD
jgi:hypothetical protein